MYDYMYVSLLLFVDVYYMKLPNFKFQGGCEHEKKDLTFPFLNLDTFLKNATPKKLANINLKLKMVMCSLPSPS